MNSPFFSIVLPIYNAKKYVAETIESILKQTYQNFEVVIVNDGSTDGSDLVAIDYANQDCRVKYFSQKNKGICSARNLAISKAEGEYVMFCDHDDVYQPHALEEIHNCLENDDYDVVKYSYTNCVLNNNIKTKSYSIGAREGGCNSKDLRHEYNRLNCFTYSVWNGAYKRKKLEHIQVSFNENIKFGMEDVAFNLTLLDDSFSIFFLESSYYTHYIRYGQSTSRKFDLNKLEAICDVVDLEKTFLGEDVSDDIKVKLMGKYIRSYFVTLSVSPNSLKNAEVKKINKLFEKKINYKIDRCKLISYLFSAYYRTDIVKVILFKAKLYKTLVFLLRGQ